MESIHPSFPSLLFSFSFLFFCFVFFYYCFVSTSRGPHSNSILFLILSLKCFQSLPLFNLSPSTFLRPLSNLYPCHCQTLSLFQKSNSQNQMEYSSVLSLAQPQLPLPFPPTPLPWVLTATA